jgi:hypothetical protein
MINQVCGAPRRARGTGRWVTMSPRHSIRRWSCRSEWVFGLPRGGAFIVIEYLIDDDRRENVAGLMTSLQMLIEFGDGFDYTGAEFRSWCTGVGFESVEVLALGGSASAAIAYK